MFCDFGTVVFQEGDSVGGVDFVECDLKMIDFNRAGIHPNTRVRVQDGNTAYKFTGNGPKTTIDPFFNGSLEPPPPAPNPAKPPPPVGPTAVPAVYQTTPVNGMLTGMPSAAGTVFCPLT